MTDSKPTPSDAPSKSQAGVVQDDVLYQKREKIFPREVQGLFTSLRNYSMVILLGLYYGLPWVHWDNHQAVLFDLPARKFHIFGITLWPQDFFYLTLLLIIAAIALFFFTTLAGRLWCGYACPQTVWTEIFIWMERKIEGSRKDQLKLEKGPLSTNKVVRRGLKHSAWLLFSLWTGFTFVGYFTPIETLWFSFWAWDLGGWEFFWIFFYGLATYGNAGWMREQVCIYMCPYSRFQSAMFDNDTLIISYDPQRGEPRGARKRNVSKQEQGLGDCVDCKLCVQVCPTGIDIRQGLQYQCISCAACVDVCDQVMNRLGYEPGLVGFTTEHSLSGEKTRLLRPRVYVYAVLLSLLTAALLYGLANRLPLELDIFRDRNALYNQTTEGLIENVYHLKLINMTNNDQQFSLAVSGVTDMKLIGQSSDITVAAGSVKDLPVRIQVSPQNLNSVSSKVSFNLKSNDGSLEVTESARFLGPVGGVSR